MAFPRQLGLQPPSAAILDAVCARDYRFLAAPERTGRMKFGCHSLVITCSVEMDHGRSFSWTIMMNIDELPRVKAKLQPRLT